MEHLGRLKTIPGIRSDERFPLVGLASAPFRGVLLRFVHNASYRFHLTFGRPSRHFLAPCESPIDGRLSLQVSDWTAPPREATTRTQRLRSLSQQFHLSPASGTQLARHAGEQWANSQIMSKRA